MLIVDEIQRDDRRLRALALGVLVGMIVLVAGLWRLQVMAAQRYARSEEAQSVRLVRVPAVRGRILDRNGLALAENRPSYDVNLYLEELRPAFAYQYTNVIRPAARAQSNGVRLTTGQIRQLEELARLSVYSNTVASVAVGLGTALPVSFERFSKHYRQALALPLPVAENLPPAQMALFFERCNGLPGVDLEVQAVRTYPYGTVASHLLGHLQRADEGDNDPESLPFRYRLRDYRGVAGVEARFDSDLRGHAGVKALRVNSQGYRHEETILQPTEPGDDVSLTLDLPLQVATARALSQVAGDGTRGAAILMDVRNGDLLAMVSLPEFDPNRFLGGITPEEFAVLNDDKQRPQMNRAVAGAYAPGSIFKVVVALAAMEAGTLDPEETHHYLGYWSMGPNGPTIDDTAPPGDYNFKRAFKRSSNAYFIDHGLKTGRARIVSMAQRFGFGQPTGYALGTEAAGYVPDERRLEAMRALRDPWTEGDTANLSIGQGALSVSPLQMAVLVAAVANGGLVFEPRIIHRIDPADGGPPRGTEPRIRSELGVSPEHLELIRRAMVADVEESEGTGKEAAVAGFRLGGKTGTAEVKRGRVLVDKITWFVAFGPAESPRYAAVVVVESGGSGGRTCAPVAGQIFRAVVQREAGTLRAPMPMPGGGSPRRAENGAAARQLAALGGAR